MNVKVLGNGFFFVRSRLAEFDSEELIRVIQLFRVRNSMFSSAEIHACHWVLFMKAGKRILGIQFDSIAKFRIKPESI